MLWWMHCGCKETVHEVLGQATVLTNHVTFCFSAVMSATSVKKQKESHEERAARFQRRSQEEATVGLMKRCIETMRDNPSVLPRVCRVLVSCGVLLVQKHEAAELGIALPTAADTSQDNKKEDASTNGSAEVDDAASGGSSAQSALGVVDAGAASNGHRNYITFRLTPCVEIEYCLTAVEPSAFSARNLKYLVEPGKRSIAKEALGELIEFTTGWDLDFKFSSQDRAREKKAQLCARQNVLLGRRARDLVLPTCWSEHGVYSIIRNAKASLQLKHNFDDRVGIIPLAALNKKHDKKDELDIVRNFSETKAALYYMPSNVFVCSCIEVLPFRPVVPKECVEEPTRDDGASEDETPDDGCDAALAFDASPVRAAGRPSLVQGKLSSAAASKAAAAMKRDELEGDDAKVKGARKKDVGSPSTPSSTSAKRQAC